MDTEFYVSDKSFRVSPFLYDGRVRYIFQNAKTLEPSAAVSIYEQFRSLTKRSHNTVRNDLNLLMYLYTWALREKVDIEQLTLCGVAPSPVQVRQFAHWLSKQQTSSKDGLEPISINRYNKVLDTSAVFLAWFITQYGEFAGTGNKQVTDREQVVASVKELFRSHKIAEKTKRCADDLTEEEIAAIERYLKPSNRSDTTKSVAVRDYLMWRLAIEFGVREGEILALRLVDCPRARQNYIKIVRVEERGKDYYDPRGTHAPRPKTLSRDLGFVIDHSPIPKLIGDYISEHRCIKVDRNGRTIMQPVLDHDFLFIRHLRKLGAPLSISGMQQVAQNISQKTGVAFHWHLARHAFFNRAYSAVMDHPEAKAKLMDLVYFGGWSDEKSLELYVNRARRDRAKTALAFWQTGMNRWEALD